MDVRVGVSMTGAVSLSPSQYESVITRGNEAIVHHIEVFECSPDVRSVPGYSGSCDDKMKPDKLDSCRHVLAAWAMGAEVRLGDAPLSASQINVLLIFFFFAKSKQFYFTVS